MSILRSAELNTPVTEEDILDLEDYFDSQANTLGDIYQRVRYQTGESALALELWSIHTLLTQAGERLTALRSQKCFPPEKALEGSRG